MSGTRTQFTATVLLEASVAFGMAELAEAVAKRFPAIGAVSVHSEASSTSGGGVLAVEGALVAVMPAPNPFPQARMAPPLRVLRAWDPLPAVRQQTAHVTVTCGGALPGIVGAKAFAAVVTFVAAAITDLGTATGIFWDTGWALTAPETFGEGADRLLTGVVPLPLWASFATVVPRGSRDARVTGTVTYGLAPFLGAEIELAPAHVDARQSYDRASMIARLAMGQEAELRDGMRIRRPTSDLSLSVTRRDSWLRDGIPSFVVVADDALVDPKTLKPKTEPAS